MNGQYPYQFDEPWEYHPDADTPINDLPTEDDNEPTSENPF